MLTITCPSSLCNRLPPIPPRQGLLLTITITRNLTLLCCHAEARPFVSVNMWPFITVEILEAPAQFMSGGQMGLKGLGGGVA